MFDRRRTSFHTFSISRDSPPPRRGRPAGQDAGSGVVGREIIRDRVSERYMKIEKSELARRRRELERLNEMWFGSGSSYGTITQVGGGLCMAVLCCWFMGKMVAGWRVRGGGGGVHGKFALAARRPLAGRPAGPTILIRSTMWKGLLRGFEST